jgi:hypothetical protein
MLDLVIEEKSAHDKDRGGCRRDQTGEPARDAEGKRSHAS